MVEPTVIPRSEHPLSRRDIDHDALKVLYRLKDAGFIAYLVGGSVRDLLLGRRPKDFDIVTSAHPYQVKRLFRNCFVIGRRFRLVHVKFGQKIIEVATFRRHVPPAEAIDDPLPPPDDAGQGISASAAARDLLINRDNTFGTPEEDAFRRDFTINALFYDIATFSIIDYVDGLRDLRERVIRAIGDPDERFCEDPVRMLRAVAFAERLGFALDPPVEEAIRGNRGEIARSAPARLIEEYYKVLRTGASASVFRTAARLEQAEARRGAKDGCARAGPQDLVVLFDQPRGGAAGNLAAVPANRLLDGRIEREPQPLGKRHRTQHAHRVFAEPFVGIPDRADHALAEIAQPVYVVDNGKSCDIVEEGVDREVAAERVFLGRAEGVVAMDQQIARRRGRRDALPGVVGRRQRIVDRFGWRHVPAKRRDLDNLLSELHVHQPEATTDHKAVAKESLDLVRMRRGDDIEVFRPATEQQIAHASTDEVRDESRVLETVQHLQRVVVNVATRQGMFGARDDGRLHHGERIISNAGLSTHTSPCSAKG